LPSTSCPTASRRRRTSASQSTPSASLPTSVAFGCCSTPSRTACRMALTTGPWSLRASTTRRQAAPPSSAPTRRTRSAHPPCCRATSPKPSRATSPSASSSSAGPTWVPTRATASSTPRPTLTPATTPVERRPRGQGRVPRGQPRPRHPQRRVGPTCPRHRRCRCRQVGNCLRPAAGHGR